MQDFIENLKDSVDALEGCDIEPNTDLTKLEDWDSVAVLSVINVVAMEYGVNLKASEISAAATPEAIFELVNSKK